MKPLKKLYYQGFTLVEMMIVVAILAILSIIAVPAYNGYLERGYLSQAHAELISINNAFKNELLKNPTSSGEEIDSKLSKFVADYKADPKIATKYRFNGQMEEAKTSRRYRLTALPIAKDYKLAIWMDSLGNTYKCQNATAAESFQTNQDCEMIGKSK